MIVGLDPSDIVLDGDLAPSPKWAALPQFTAYVYCGQTAAWIKMPLGMEISLGSDHIVLDGDPAPPPQKGAQLPNFRPMFVVAKQLDGSRCHLVRWYPGPGQHCVRCGSSSTPSSTAPNFGPCLFVAKRLGGSRSHLVGR